ncbi:MAG TPA: ASCH domain-containing protein [Candidatus Faeciplasma pullistercoris]|uniref:ASCH domain-containing protein n=1 Tax=Candidatus Faeciplasma pullistercoris TaxID=2840800 RepID=A0A9D1KK19_9FIRM|nr:ASCH domain-containing protein [Candidatus Faeciplasma pullistercoris]
MRGKEIILHSEYILLSKEPAEHQMNLYSEPFEMIKSGRKTIELRLWDEKRQKIRIGDIIVFTNIAGGEKLQAAVVNLHRFSSFEELYRSLPLLKCGYTEDNIGMANALDMEKYYSTDKQKKYGVVGIELSSPKQIKD